MEYIISFLEGIITFISPCLLPMLPIYLTYFAGGQDSGAKGKVLRNAVGFSLGFTTVFVLLGAFAGTVGGLLVRYQTWVNIITGAVVILFGLSFLGVFQLRLFKGAAGAAPNAQTFLSSFLFGVVFSVGWTPCVGAFLGSALLLASQQGSALKGIFMLLCYSAGLAIPFILSAVLLEQLRRAFDWVKQHYDAINKICGILLIIMGVLMATGTMTSILSRLAF